MYNYRNSRNGRRRMRGIYGFPWLLFVIILFNFHSLPWILMTLVVMGFVFLIIKAFMTTTTSNTATNGTRTQHTYQPYQTPIYQPPYQPSTPIYQPPTPIYQPSTPIYQPPYQPYQQGYQAAQETYQEEGQPRDYPVAETYDQYEQPQAQYPEQMPPMQQ
jgi:hypothetical protein